jgi:ribosomal protein S27E
MDRQGLSVMQRFFTRLAGPETAAAMEAHSRAWLVQCPSCGHERSIWDLGGIRYKAAGNPRIRVRCPRCGNAGWNKVYKAADFPTTSVPVWPLIRLILICTLVAAILVALVGLLVTKLSGAG